MSRRLNLLLLFRRLVSGGSCCVSLHQIVNDLAETKDDDDDDEGEEFLIAGHFGQFSFQFMLQK